MIFHRHLKIIVGILLAFGTAEAAVAQQPNAYPLSNVNLRAGPGTDYPVIVTVQPQAPISILGCLGDYTWCDVTFGYSRGWMKSIYLSGLYQGYYYPLRDYAPRLGYSVIDFDINKYWSAYYRDRPFYQDLPQWGRARSQGWVDKAVFYDRLQPYGDWVWLEGQYVWVPGNVDRGWHPYTFGHWVYTNSNGWMWASDEPFGWATYHYGRWGFSNKVGWFWVPGSRWGPAWVSWRASDNYLAWAPLPPSYDEDVGINIRVEAVPNYYWRVVPAGAFVSSDLSRYILRDEPRYEPILQETRPLGNVAINNNVVVNNVVNVNYVEQKTNEKIVVHQIEKTPDANNAGKIQGGAIEVFQPGPDQRPKVAAPPRPKNIEEVAAQTKTKEQGAGKPSTEELLVPPEVKKPLDQASRPPPLPLQKSTAPNSEGGKQKNANGAPGEPSAIQPGAAPAQPAMLPPPQQAEGEQGGKPKKGNGGPADQTGAAPGAQPAMLPPPQQAEGEQGGKPKKVNGGAAADQNGAALDAQPGMLPPPQQAEGEQGGKPKKGNGGPADQTGAAPGAQPGMLPPPQQAEGEQGGKPKKGNGGPADQTGAAPGAQPGMLPPPQQAEGEQGGKPKKGNGGPADQTGAAPGAQPGMLPPPQQAEGEQGGKPKKGNGGPADQTGAAPGAQPGMLPPPQQAEGEHGGKPKKGNGGHAPDQTGALPGAQPGMPPPPQQAEGEQGGKQNGKGGPQAGGIHSARHGPSIGPRSRDARSQTRRHCEEGKENCPMSRGNCAS